MRLWIAAGTGFKKGDAKGRWIGGHYRPFFDLTDEPMPTLTTANHRGERLMIEDDGRPWPSPDPAKPPYLVPSMEDVRATPASGYRVVSTFTGAGGSCLGFRMAGFTPVYAVEFIEAARDTYRANFPGVHVDPRDVREIRPEDILERTGLAVGQLDVLEGSPPCASFSTAGKRERGWGRVNAYSGTTQRVDDLFGEYVRLLRGLMPRTFVAENVSGLVKGKAKGYFKAILADMRASGYRVRAQLLDAQWLGVPQMRQRLIFVGVREDLDAEPAFPRPLPYRYSVREALPWLTGYRYDNSGWTSTGDLLDDVARTVTISAGVAPVHHKVQGPLAIYDRRGTFGEMELEEFSQADPAPTVMAHGMGGVARHQIGVAPRGEATTNFPTGTDEQPTGPRKFTIGELRRICAFPDDFVLTGDYPQQWERLGRAVPPLMMRAVAEVLRDRVLLPLDARSAA